MKFKIVSISLIIILLAALGLILGFNWEAITTNLTKDNLYTESEVVQIKKDIEEKYKKEIENNLLKINEFEEKFKTQTQTLKENEETISQLKEKDGVNLNRIKELEQENSTIRSQLQSINSSYKTLQEQYKDLQSRFSSLQNDLNVKNNEYDTLKNQYDELNKSFNSLQSSFENLQNQYNNLSSILNAYKTGYFDGLNVLRDSDFSEEEKLTFCLNEKFINNSQGGKNLNLICAYKNENIVTVLILASNRRSAQFYNYITIDVSSLGPDFKITKEFLLNFSDDIIKMIAYYPLSHNSLLDDVFKSEYSQFKFGNSIFSEDKVWNFDEIYYKVTFKDVSEEHVYSFKFLVIEQGIPVIFEFTKTSSSYLDEKEEVKNQLINLVVVGE